MPSRSNHKPKYRRHAPIPTKCPHCGAAKPLKVTARNSPTRKSNCVKCGEAIKLRTPTAYVDIGGKRRWLGAYGSKSSREKYDQLVAAKQARELGEIPDDPPPAGSDLTINELLLPYYRWALNYYVDQYAEPDEDGRRPPSDTIHSINAAVNRLRDSFGLMRVDDFGPIALKTLRQSMIDERIEIAGTEFTRQALSRTYINEVVNRIRQIFKWGVENEKVDVTLYQRLQTVAPLKKGRCTAREAPARVPVAPEWVDAVLASNVSPQIAAMIRLQRLTGMRPGEVCRMRACDLDMAGDVWLYKRDKHKTAHHGKSRVIALGPKAQLILRPFLTTELTRFLFSPRDAVAWRSDRLRKGRKSKVQPSQQNRRKQHRRRPPGECYTSGSYRAAVQRACRRANVPEWKPYDLRHLYTTEVRQSFGEEAAQVSLGHSKMDTTAIYGERNIALAKRVAKEIG